MKPITLLTAPIRISAVAATMAALSAGCSAQASGPASPPVSSTALQHTRDVRAVFQVHGDHFKKGVGEGLFYARKIVEAYEKLGVERSDLHFVVVLHGDAGYWALNDSAWQADPKHTRAAADSPRAAEQNPNAELIATLRRWGVRVELCSSTMRNHGWTREDLLSDVIVIPNAYPRVIDLQMSGYAHVLFD